MKTKIRLKPFLPLFLLGVTAGFLNGFLGFGGGIVTVLAMKAFGKKRGWGESEVFVHSMLAVLPISVLSFVLYLFRFDLSLGNLWYLLLPAALGGILGSFFLTHVKTRLPSLLFAAMSVISGILMWVRA